MEIQNKSTRGGKRPGAGRPKGSRDAATVEQKATLEELARSHTETALNVLVSVAEGSESDSARVSAATALLDRGYGKPRQSLEVAGDPNNPLEVINRIERVIIGAPQDTADRDTESIPTAH
jgi:hypothetical protein